MEVILLERIETLGQMGEVVKVKPGFARNFLLPQKKALRANKTNLAYFESQKAQLEAEEKSHQLEVDKLADIQLQMDRCKILAPAGQLSTHQGSSP